MTSKDNDDQTYEYSYELKREIIVTYNIYDNGNHEEEWSVYNCHRRGHLPKDEWMKRRIKQYDDLINKWNKDKGLRYEED